MRERCARERMSEKDRGLGENEGTEKEGGHGREKAREKETDTI